jgi:hypothetical protein
VLTNRSIPTATVVPVLESAIDAASAGTPPSPKRVRAGLSDVHPPGDAPYWLSVETRDGSSELHRLPRPDVQPWSVTVDADPSTITAVAVVDNTGTVWCTAQLARA